jgi:hypothetical protein
MAKATIKIEFTAGPTIKETFEEAIRIAKILKVWVEFEVNDVTCMVDEDSIADLGVQSYLNVHTKKKGPKVAIASSFCCENGTI